jgi:hypothetical protein
VIPVENLPSRLVGSRTAALFLLFWLIFGAATNTRNLREQQLQHMGIDALVAHHTFTLNLENHPPFHPIGDYFKFKSDFFAAKQPGQFVWGAIPYFVIHALGVTYESDYDLSTALVTWFSTGLFTALALALLDRMMHQLWGFSGASSLLATLSIGLGTSWFCYTGYVQHDMLASSLLVFALYSLELNRHRHSGRNQWLALGSGALLGLVVFTSMLPALLVLVVGVYILCTMPFRASLWHGAGFLIGLLPLFTYNGWYFGNPLVQANVAGKYNDTFFSIHSKLWAHHLNAYLGTGWLSIWKYEPVAGFGLAGLFLLPRRLRYLFAAAVTVHLFYLVHIESLGGNQYGPRYLLPLLPLLAPGLAGLLDRREVAAALRNKLLAAGALAVLGYSIFVNLVGAFQGTMCIVERFALWQQLELPWAGHPLSGFAVFLAMAAGTVWVWRRYVMAAPVKAVPSVASRAQGKQKRPAASTGSASTGSASITAGKTRARRG